MTVQRVTVPQSKRPKHKNLEQRVKAQKQAQKETKGEFGLPKKEFVACPECDAWYYDKSWHHALEDFKHLGKKDKRIAFKICPACLMKKNKTYEGAVIVANVPEKIKNELLALIRNVGERARKRDPMDRILELKEKNGSVEAYTSENQLALSIANQIKRGFKHHNIKATVTWSKEEDVARMRLSFGG